MSTKPVQYEPHCQMRWSEMVAGADDQARTVEQVMSELNQSMAVLTEIEKIPPPHDEMTQYRRACAEWLAHRALCEAQAVKDARSAIKKAAEVKA